MKYAILMLFVVTLFSCADDSEIVDIKELRGNWVEIKNVTDTLSFKEPIDDKELVYLKRAEFFRSGPYEYELLPNNKISIHWLLAASMSFNEYTIKINGDRLSVGNFYESPSGEILTFRRID